MIAGIVVGAGSILAVIGFFLFAQDKGLVVRWWQWLLLIIALAILLLSVGFLGTMVAEGTMAEGLAVGGIGLLVTFILGALVARSLRRAA